MTMDAFWLVTLVTLIAGVFGTGIGGLVGALIKAESNRMISLLLSIAAGIMLAIVCFNLLIEAVEEALASPEFGIGFIIVSVAAGIAAIGIVDRIIDERTAPAVEHTASSEHPKTHDDIDELIHADNYMHQRDNTAHGGNRFELFIAGVVMAAAIGLHNLPEGMTIGASFAAGEGSLILSAGMTMAFLIGLHNIPEGMSVAVPLIAGGMGRVRAVLLTAACGIPTLLGSWLGFWLGDFGSLGLILSLGFASGAMLYVIFAEIIPEAVLMYRSKTPTFALMGGFLLGLLIVFL